MPEPSALGELRVVKSIPWSSFAWVALELALLVAIVWLLWREGLLTQRPALAACALLTGGIIAAHMAVFGVRPLMGFVLDPGVFTLGHKGFRFGAREIPYRAIRYLRHDYGYHYTDIGLPEKHRIRLYWQHWGDPALWGAALAEHSLAGLLDSARATLKRHVTLDFGGMVKLNGDTLSIKGKRLPLGDIDFVADSFGSTWGGEYGVLRVGAHGQTWEADLSKIRNPHVLMALLELLLQPERV
jgi:hypothetical protein